MYVSIAVSNGNREEDNRASARNPPSRGFHAPDGTRSSSTNRRSTLVPSVAFVNPAFSPMERVKGEVRIKEKNKKNKKKEHDFNPIDFEETRFDRGDRFILDSFEFVRWLKREFLEILTIFIG